MKKWLSVLIVPLFLFNILFFTLKITTVILEKDSRSLSLVSHQLAELIPSGSSVIGDDVMIYIADKNGWNYQVLNHYKTPKIREERLREQFDYEFLLVSKLYHDKSAEEFSLYEANSNLTLVKRIELVPHPINQILEKIGLSTMEKHGYSYLLYKRD